MFKQTSYKDIKEVGEFLKDKGLTYDEVIDIYAFFHNDKWKKVMDEGHKIFDKIQDSVMNSEDCSIEEFIKEKLCQKKKK